MGHDTPGVREQQAALMRRRRASERDIEIPDIADPKRRRKGERDIEYALRTYFPNRFYNPFTSDQRDMIQWIMKCATNGEDRAIAAERGGGKTTLAECVIIMLLVRGVLKFPVIVAKTGPESKRILANIKGELQYRDELAEDYPEVCVPIRALEGAPQRAGMQTVDGRPTRMEWKDSHFILPTVEGSQASGSIFAARGADGAIRGLNVRGVRPDFVLIDDPDSRESASSEIQTEQRKTIIDQDIAGLAGPGKNLGRLMLCTLLNRNCVAAQYTDTTQKPNWRGMRLTMVKRWPDREDLWEEYIALRRAGQDPYDDTPEEAALEHYQTHQKAMDKGAEISNPYNYVPPQLSALQKAYDLIADLGLNNFRTEYQNDPPEEEVETSDISAGLVRRRLSGFERNVCPPDTDVLTHFVDIGKYRLHYATIAWRSGAIGDIVDYGVKPTSQPNVIGEEKAIMMALQEHYDMLDENPYVTEDGEIREIDQALVDVGYRGSVVQEFLRVVGKPWTGAMGTDGNKFHPPAMSSRTRKPGGPWWYWSRQTLNLNPPERVWQINVWTDKWKHWVHERFVTDHVGDDGERRPGSLVVFGDAPKPHQEFSEHITAEVFVRSWAEGKGWSEKWEEKRKDNHWFDCVVGCCVAGAMKGIRLFEDGEQPRKKVVAQVGASGSWFAQQRRK